MTTSTPRSKKKTVFTIGHSTRTIDQFLALLHAYDIEVVIDIRTVPGSSHYPQFNQERLKASLQADQIRYCHIKGLGGFRRAAKNSINQGWENPSFRGFADYMQTAAFQRALERLERVAMKKRSVLMCAEALFWRCHRNLIADALTIKKWSVLHIQSQTTARPHQLTSFLHLQRGQLVYPSA